MNNDYSPRTEQRQHLNISKHAFEILSNDIFAFSESGGMSGMINRILENFMDDSEASISAATERKRLELINIVRKEKGLDNITKVDNNEDRPTKLSSSEEKVIEYLVSDYRKRLEDHFMIDPAPKEKTLKIRLRNEIYDILGPAVPLADEGYKTAGNYIKAILEDYASQSFYKREEIYYRPLCEKIRSELRASFSERILMTIKIGHPDNIQTYRIKPYGMSTESDFQYHYLIALSKPVSGKADKYAPAVFRLSRILKLEESPSYGSGKITEKEQKAVRDAITTKGLPYLMSDVEEFVIQLTPEGMAKYHVILHQRPNPDETKTIRDNSGNVIMHFYCTYRQIENYFFQFGKDALIISPEKYMKDLKMKYKESYDAYDL